MAEPGLIETGIKIGHHAHDHELDGAGKAVSKATDPELRGRGPVNPTGYAFSKATSAAMTGAGVLTLFFGLYYGLKSIASSLIPAFAGAEIVTGLLVAALTGAIWYGGKHFMQAYGEANEHNQTLTSRIKRGLGLGRDREQTASLGAGRFIPEMDGTVITPAGPMNAPVTIAASPYVEESPNRQRPAFVSNILEKGPRSFDPTDILARRAEERAASDVTRT